MRRVRLLLLATLVTLLIINHASVSALQHKVVRLSSTSLVSNGTYIPPFYWLRGTAVQTATYTFNVTQPVGSGFAVLEMRFPVHSTYGELPEAQSATCTCSLKAVPGYTGSARLMDETTTTVYLALWKGFTGIVTVVLTRPGGAPAGANALENGHVGCAPDRMMLSYIAQ
ncbi:MAG: hypothetical protein K6U03_07685 [Firmicutes bacterium]|nr:hypothetical protein [Bacillota bacterium]